MIICIDGFTPETIGRFVFLNRLMPAMEKLGCTFQYDIVNADAVLFTRKNRYVNTGSSIPKIVRPVHIHMVDKESTRSSNAHRADLCRNADLVIWQCQWLKDKYRTLLGFKAKRDAIIYNAIDSSYFDGFNPASFPMEKTVIMLAAWAADGVDRPRKRLREMVGVAVEYAKAHGDTWFCVIGDTNGYEVEDENIIFMGRLPFDAIASHLLGADAMLNLSYLDNCPSAVVEALVAGLPVVCNNETGVTELVRKDGGIIVGIDEPVIKYVPLRNPPKFDKQPVIKALETVLNGWPKFERPELDINYAAQRYYSAIKEVVYGH